MEQFKGGVKRTKKMQVRETKRRRHSRVTELKLQIGNKMKVQHKGFLREKFVID